MQAAPAQAAPAITWDALLEKYLAWGRVQGGKGGMPWNKIHASQAAFRLDWWHRQLGAILPNEVTLEALEAQVPKIPGRTVKKKVRPSSPKTKRDYVCMLLTFRTWCHTRQLARIPDPDPLEPLRTLDGDPEVEYRALTVAEYRALLAVAPPMRREMYIILALTGLRIGQLQQIRKSWVDLENRTIHSPKGAVKKRKRVATAMSPLVAEYIRLRMEGKGPDDLLFKFSQNFLNRKFHQDLNDAGIKLITPEGKAALHGMRDTAVTVLQEECGFSLAAASKFVDHGEERITQRSYTSINLKRKHEAAEALEGTLVTLPNARPEGFIPSTRSGEGMSKPVQRDAAQNRLQPEELAAVGSNLLERVKGIEPSLKPQVNVNVFVGNEITSPQAEAHQLGECAGIFLGKIATAPAHLRNQATRIACEAVDAFLSAQAQGLGPTVEATQPKKGTYEPGPVPSASREEGGFE